MKGFPKRRLANSETRPRRGGEHQQPRAGKIRKSENEKDGFVKKPRSILTSSHDALNFTMIEMIWFGSTDEKAWMKSGWFGGNRIDLVEGLNEKKGGKRKKGGNKREKGSVK